MSLSFDHTHYAGNMLLAATATEDLESLAPDLEWADHAMRDRICEPGEPMSHVYFPVSGLFSLVTMYDRHNQVEASMTGNEGLLGSWLALFVKESPFLLIAQAPGRSLRMRTDLFLAATVAMPLFRTVLLRYSYAVTVQLASTIMANSSYTIQERLARWILMTQDRLATVSFPMTHEFMALMLAVRRQSVTEAVHELESKRLVKASRGCMLVRSRSGLEELAGNSYGHAESEHRRLIIPALRPH